MRISEQIDALETMDIEELISKYAFGDVQNLLYT